MRKDFKKKTLAIAVVACCLALVAGGTWAYFTDDAKAHNVITSGGVGIEIVETQSVGGAEVEYPSDPIGNIMPGTSVSKIVRVANTDAGEAWIRAKVTQVITPAPGVEKLPSLYDADGVEVPAVSYDLGADWLPGEDGWYYYTKPVPKGDATAELFRQVDFAKQMGNEYQNCKVSIQIQAQAVQTANNPVPKGGSVLDVKGWPVEGADEGATAGGSAAGSSESND